MVVSTKGRYALRVIVDIAEHDKGEFIPLKDIAKRQNISLKYIEGIMTELSKANLVYGLHGKGGGYRLAVSPDKMTVKSILDVTEKSLASVACLKTEKNTCPNKDKCRTLPMWEKLDDMIEGFLSSVNISDLRDKRL